ncbi:MAG: oligosaccharide flippase family protein [Flavobacteriales bacterium]|nr:oligosaccharide flippase family protein [Flavobacteriales bacterium]
MKVFKSVSVFAVVTIISSGISFLLLPILTKYLSKEDYGILSLFNASTRFFSILISLGVTSILMTKIFKTDNFSLSSYFKTYYVLILLNCFVVSIFVIISFLYFDDFFGIPKKIALFIPLISLGILFYELILSLMIYKRQPLKYAITALSKFGLEILLTLFFVVFLFYNWEGRVGALIITIIFVNVISLRYLKKEKLLNGKFDITKLKEMVLFGAPFLMFDFSTVVLNLSDRYFIEYFLGLSEAGIYGIGSLVGSLVLIAVNSLINVFRPIIYEKISCYLQEKRSLRNISIQYFITLLAATIFLVFVLKKIIFIYFIDAKFFASEEIVWTIAFGFFYWGLYAFYLSYFIFEKQTKTIFIVSFLLIFLNLALNYILIPKFGIIGAGYATLATYFFGGITVYLLFIFRLKPQLLLKYKLKSKK